MATSALPLNIRIGLLSILIPVLLFLATTPADCSVSITSWKFPCDSEEHPTVDLDISDEMVKHLATQRARHASVFLETIGSTLKSISPKLLRLKRLVKLLKEDYLRIRLPGHDSDSFRTLSSKMIPSIEVATVKSVVKTDMVKLLHLAYENLARFSLHLYLVIDGENDPKFPEYGSYSDRYVDLHNHQGHGVRAILCLLHQVMTHTDKLPEQELVNKIEGIELIEAAERSDSDRLIGDFVSLRDVETNLEHLSEFFKIIVSSEDNQEDENVNEGIVERSQRSLGAMTGDGYTPDGEGEFLTRRHSSKTTKPRKSSKKPRKHHPRVYE